jgi:hypothetical protein
MRYEEAASLWKRHDNGFDKTELLSSGLLRILKELLKSDKIQITVDEPVLNNLWRVVTKLMEAALCHYEGTPSPLSRACRAR